MEELSVSIRISQDIAHVPIEDPYGIISNFRSLGKGEKQTGYCKKRLEVTQTLG